MSISAAAWVVLQTLVLSKGSRKKRAGTVHFHPCDILEKSKQICSNKADHQGLEAGERLTAEEGT